MQASGPAMAATFGNQGRNGGTKQPAFEKGGNLQNMRPSALDNTYNLPFGMVFVQHNAKPGAPTSSPTSTKLRNFANYFPVPGANGVNFAGQY